ncbi:hypothetical protein MES5069_270075 [Mesorhizobium escarrei]|uniref:Uncharacterized protein n=1 Tax=Mesorhizobium escarrei TaxID=666018 RepID=A0ABN8JRV3_9HYPH|nr:hypothetical protein MES5069_270075 [Mesorhizobium escarrei]
MTRFQRIEDSIGGRVVSPGYGVGANEEQSAPLVRTCNPLKEFKGIFRGSMGADEMSRWHRKDWRRPQQKRRFQMRDNPRGLWNRRRPGHQWRRGGSSALPGY